MALYSGRLLIRGGNESDFDPDKMMPREWAVSTDRKIVRICVSPGEVIRMATYDAFEEDMAKIENILKECQTIQEVVVRINTEVSKNADAVAEYTAQAKQYRDEAKTSADNAKTSETNAKASENNAKESENNAKLTEERAREVFESIPEDYSTISNDLYELAIKETASGEEIHLNDSSNLKLREFALYGKAKQNTTSGKNLLENIYKTTIQKGVTFTVNENDGSITVSTNGETATETVYYNIAESLTEKYSDGIERIFSGCPSGGSGTSYRISGYIYNADGTYNRGVADIGNGAKFTLNQGEKLQLQIVISSGAKIDNLIFYPMVRLASITDDTYEPYTGGIPSPNPDYPQEIEVSGKSYNLLENIVTSQEKNGIKFVVNNDGSVTVNGTATSTTTLELFNTLSKGTYIASGCPKNGSTGTYSIQNKIENTNGVSLGEDSGNGVTITLTEETVVCSYIRIASGYTANNLKFYPMIRKASVKNDRYMPYGKGSVEVKSVGKNKLKNTAASQTVNGITFTINEDRSVTVNGTANSTAILHLTDGFKFEVDKKYIVSGCPSGGGYDTWQLRIYDGVSIAYGDIGNGVSVSDFECELAQVFIRIGAGTVCNNLTFKPMIRLVKDTDDTYEPYKETTGIIPTPNGLAGIKVSSDGNYTDQNGQQWICDEIVKYADGSGEYIQKLKYMKVETVLNSWSNFDGSGKIFALVKDAKNNISSAIKGNVISNMCETLTDIRQYNSNVSAVSLTTDGRVCLSIIGITNKEDMQAFVDNNDMYILYELAEPITTPLTAEELAEIEKLSTFYPVTNIYNDADCGMKVTYIVDAKKYIDNKIAELATAMVNKI